jgi:hypothetical protein
MQMPPEHEADEAKGYGPSMRTVAWAILVMGISLALVIVLWIWFGHIGPSFSANRLLDQQTELRQQYGLPYHPPIPKSLLEVPPSERALVAGNTTTASNSTNSTK